MLAPAILLSRLNSYLATFSPVYAIQIGNLDLGLLTFSYTGKETKGIYKKDGHTFFTAKKVRVQISLRELLHGRILTNVRIDDGHFVLTNALLEGSKTPDAKPIETAKRANEVLFPLRIAVVELHDCSFDFADFFEQASKTRWRVTGIEGKALNINPLPSNPYTTFAGDGRFLDDAPFKISGKAKRLEQPLAWKIEAEIRDFNLVSANPMLLRSLPFSFAKGRLDLYAEVKSQNGRLEGYAKPFLKDVAVIHAGEKYKSVKHFAFEIAGAFANFMLKRADDKTFAAKLAFKRQGSGPFEVEGGEAVLDALKHGYFKPLTPGIEDSVPFN